MEKNFWTSDKKNFSQLYNLSAIKIPSDIPAYKLTYDLLSPKGKIILDFGCFNGSSSRILLKLGAKKVIGCDKIRKHIEKAKEKYHSNNLLFIENKRLDSEKFYDFFDAVAMTFVHPTISNKRELTEAFKLISKITRENAYLIILGLHQNSLKKKNHFLFYNPKLRNETDYKDGVPFKNEIKFPDSNICMRFLDYCWTEKTLKKLLEENNFKITKIISLKHNLKSREGKILSEYLKELPEIKWIDEWKAPLYQIIVAKKILQRYK